MVFTQLVAWISGIFGKERKVVYKDELDEIVDTVVNGFSKISQKASQNEAELLSLKQEIIGVTHSMVDYNSQISKDMSNISARTLFLEKQVYAIKDNASLKQDLKADLRQDIKQEIMSEIEAKVMLKLDPVISHKIAESNNAISSTVRAKEYDTVLKDIYDSLKSLQYDIKSLKSKPGHPGNDVITAQELDYNKPPYNNVATANNNVVTAPKHAVFQKNSKKYTPDDSVYSDDSFAEDMQDSGSVDISQRYSPVITPKTGQKTLSGSRVITPEISLKPTKTVITPRNINRMLASALLPVFNELLNAEKFLSYAELGRRIGKKETTARAYVNALRNFGISIEEETVSNGRKLVRLAKDVRREYIIPE